MSSALVPVYTKLRHDSGDKRAWDLVSNVISTLAIVLTGVALVGILFADQLVTIFAPAFSEVPGKHEMTVHMTRILWPFLPLVVLAAIWMGILNARDRYGTPALAPTLFNLVSTLSAFTICPLLAYLWGVPLIYGWAVGATLGGLAQWLVQVPALRREGFRYRPHLSFSDPALKRMVVLMGAGTFGLAATQINILVNSVLASGLGNGPVSWLYFAFRLMQFPIGVFGVAISTATLTKVSLEAAKNDLVSVEKSLREALRMVIVLTVPSAVGLAVLGSPIIAVIYQHGRFGADDTLATAQALAGYALGLTAYSGVRVMVPVLYSLGRSRSAIFSSGVSMVANVSLCFALVGPLGFQGLAMAMSFAAIINAGALLWLLSRHIKQIQFTDLVRCLFATLAASLVMAIFVYLLLTFVGISPLKPIPLTSVWVNANFLSHLLFLLFALAVGVASYGVAGRLLGLDELERIQGYIWKRLTHRRGRP
jgi:putative peptidoglycan lipid II flippase